MSSRSVTPARRGRDDESESDSDQSVSEDQSRPVQSSTSKRVRRNDNDGSERNANSVHLNVPAVDTVSARTSDARPLLPDSFRRSPKGKGRAMERASGSGDSQDFQPGSIIRVTLNNFVTYTKAEFHPGPNLNMVIGPNGTGKSTLVCAICLGLGWNTSHLGRAKDIGEFVKHGAESASIEIELAKDSARHRRNPVISCGIVKDGNKTKFSINGQKSNKKEVQELAQSFSIQVDNLCQFLPQDRVVEFAALSPVELLAQTQRAAAPEQMTEWHEQLKNMRKVEKQRQSHQHDLTDELKNLEDRQRSQEGDVVRLRERAQLLEKVAILEKLRPYSEYKLLRRQHTEAKDKRKTAQRELRRLEAQIGPRLAAATEKDEYLKQIQKTLTRRRRVLEKTETDSAKRVTKYADLMKTITDCSDEINVEKNGNKKSKQSLQRHQQDIAEIQRAMDHPPPDFDPAEINEQVRQKKSQIRDNETKISDFDINTRNLIDQGRQKRAAIERLESQCQGLQSQVGRQTNKLGSISRDAATAWKWIQENQGQFSGRVYGPPMIECSVKNARHADFVETILPESEILAFTVTSQDDFKMLQNQLYTQMRLTEINIRSCTQSLSQFQAPLSTDQLSALGLDCFVLDLIEGPEAVLAMLCDSGRIHQTAYTHVEPSDKQHDAIAGSGLTSWITPTVFNQLTRRREYGNTTSTRVRPVRKARLLTDAPVDLQIEQDLKRQMAETADEVTQIEGKVREMREQVRTLREANEQLQRDCKQIGAEKAQKQRQLAEFNALPTKLDGAQRKLNDVRQQVAGCQQRVLQIEERLDGHYLEKGQIAVDYARSIEALRSLHVQVFEAEIMEIEAASDLEQMQARHQEEQNMLQQHQDELTELTEVEQRVLAKGKQLERQLTAFGPTLSAEESEVQEVVMHWEPDQMETEIQSVQAQLDMLHGGNEHLIREYELRGRKIEEKRNKVHELEASLQNLATEIAQTREAWEPQLDALVAQISAAFAENFSRIQCVGEVAVHKDEDFAQWAIQIKVKFREQEQLSILDSHRQSGGERAVSTIFYLMALQSLARAPFRVVDEINQGMDPRNERLVHSRMVDIACAEHSCQYFLITPKLLNGLKYHPRMKVHCIASGEYMPDDHRQLNFSVLAKRALAVRAAVAAS